MLSRSVATLSRRAFAASSSRLFTTVREAAGSTADDALKYSGYSSIDFTIPEDAKVYDAVQKFAAFNIGCLVTTDKAGNMTGIVSERDYITKIALLGRTSKETPVKDIATIGGRIITAKASESVER
jgi:signal-transduction protein with cAMP-binding, CBS, and nucleotidyltransferase domain